VFVAHYRLRHGAIDKVVGLLGHDLKTRLMAFKTYYYATGGMYRVSLHATYIHAPFDHRREYAPAGRIVADAADKQGRQSETLKMPSDVERRATQHGTAVGEDVVQHLSENQGSRCLFCDTILLHSSFHVFEMRFMTNVSRAGAARFY
jgi:hypothetical protein